MTLRANKNGTWVGGDDQSAGTTVYGKLGADWLYAKAVFANKNGTWERAWTDCRQHDASGGRDWSSSSSTSTVTCASCDDCGTSTKNVTVVTYTKTGCLTYTRTSETACTSCGTWNVVSGSAGEVRTFNGVSYQYAEFLASWRRTSDPNCAGSGGTNGYYEVTQCSVTSAYRTTLIFCSDL
jgi:hypothetical protein